MLPQDHALPLASGEKVIQGMMGGRFVMGINIPTIFVRMLSSHLFMLLKLL